MRTEHTQERLPPSPEQLRRAGLSELRRPLAGWSTERMRNLVWCNYGDGWGWDYEKFLMDAATVEVAQ